MHSFPGCSTCLGEAIIASSLVMRQEVYCSIAPVKSLHFLLMNDQFRYSAIRWGRGGMENEMKRNFKILLCSDLSRG